MDKDVIILLVNGFRVIVTVYCFVSDYYVIALVGMVSNFFLSFYKLIDCFFFECFFCERFLDCLIRWWF